VQHHAVEPCNQRLGGGRELTDAPRGPVLEVADYRHSIVCEVDTDLVSPAGQEVGLEERGAGEAFTHAPACDRAPALRNLRRVLLAIAGSCGFLL
jgi:hypothetical protein